MKLLTFFFLTILLFTISSTRAQTGTYEKQDQSGASCTIAVAKHGTKAKAAIFAWWGIPSGRNGNFSGEGIIKANTCVFNGGTDDLDCSIAMSFGKDELKVKFNDCMADNLPDDFSGIYHKIADVVPGAYQLAVKTYFYKKPNLNSRSNAYLLMGDRVIVDLENIRQGGWVFINYGNKAGKSTNGYIRLENIKARANNL
ncbi:hypothetical protein [Mucilaginibacter polytrichastri]|uniref:SH3b domain-containing protein n=1 Tax=Mucilaginibacter polytrichastri TaxID=1302689 RepID=A0A1Q6A0K2_9SPHI|nr:hypothetical protein [Mucilaginibacter polytrichastri]OKS87511.1 hypothetical protein RG47T_2972 [Mucilaginibacter polytrichastri]SFS91546.1 hypothetical protein SAMN04487890_106106 [Mucilaginibacter polytrichastri]